ncbi:alpha beta hydrolase protein [Fusarium austroafricanum]|uniref:Alpha beta hydrolase protein n=1 Tax=Fusarium austroafricanum TaxID=2364996 RepID=A0A8H4KN06_9HYPO|nr:alpha beta hydrolase protein [Fusarium austroafricanum]
MAQPSQSFTSSFRRMGIHPGSIPYPLIICFHGSGDSCDSWEPLTRLLTDTYRLLLWDRKDPNVKPETAVSDLLKYLDDEKLSESYVLVAHSYGGTFARLFLDKRPHQVAGMVLAETGQETAIDPEMEKRQYKKRIMGNKPLVVIRGNTLKWKQLQYEQALASEQNLASPTLTIQKQLLDATDKEDERLKKAQLQLSRNNRYMHLPDVGHGVIRETPEVVKEAIYWVMGRLKDGDDEELEDETQSSASESDTSAKKSFGRRLRRVKKISLLTRLFKKSDG